MPRPAKQQPKTSYKPYRRYANTYRKYPKKTAPKKSIGETIGSNLGALIGRGAQSLFKHLTGFGDYTVHQNSLVPPTVLRDPPPVMNTPEKDNVVIVRHREYIADVYASEEFRSIDIDINPGLLESFPWLSQIANSFEQYQFRGLIFEYKSTSSDSVLSSGSSSALGSVMMSTQYNSDAEPFKSKVDMLNHEFANSCKPSVNMYHPIECAINQTSIARLYVRNGDLTNSQNILNYDLGKFQIATVGMQNASPNQVVGELWCTYEIAFLKSNYLDLDERGNQILTYKASNVTYSNAGPLGNGTVVVDPESSLKMSVKASGDVLYFPEDVNEGIFLIQYFWIGSSTAVTVGTLSNTGCSGINSFNGDTSSTAVSPGAGATSTRVSITQVVKVNQSGAYITLSGFTLPSSGTSFDIIVTQMKDYTI